MDFHRWAATCGASTRSCSLSHFLASLRVLISPSLVATRYSSWSSFRQAVPEPSEDIFLRIRGIHVFSDGHPPIVQLLQEAVEVEGVAIVHGGLDLPTRRHPRP